MAELSEILRLSGPPSQARNPWLSTTLDLYVWGRSSSEAVKHVWEINSLIIFRVLVQYALFGTRRTGGEIGYSVYLAGFYMRARTG